MAARVPHAETPRHNFRSLHHPENIAGWPRAGTNTLTFGLQTIQDHGRVAANVVFAGECSVTRPDCAGCPCCAQGVWFWAMSTASTGEDQGFGTSGSCCVQAFCFGANEYSIARDAESMAEWPRVFHNQKRQDITIGLCIIPRAWRGGHEPAPKH